MGTFDRNSVYSPFSSPAIAAFSEASLLIGDDKWNATRTQGRVMKPFTFNELLPPPSPLHSYRVVPSYQMALLVPTYIYKHIEMVNF